MQEVQAGAPLAGARLPMGSIVKERYIVEDLLGQGGFGAVYSVKDARVRGNMFALKEVVDPDRKDRERFLFEAELLKRLEHRALPRVYRIFDDNKQQRAYMLMDYIEGSNLEMLRQQQLGKRFPLSEVLTLMAPIVDAIAYLHRQNPPVIHRDIKPSNIIAPLSGDDAVLVDFGIAKEHSPDNTTTAIRRCSPGYAAPEQYGIGTSTLTDVYGLGATFYTLLTGIVPADALHRITELNSTGNDPLIPIQKLAPDVPPHIASIIHRALSLNSGDRFPTVDHFWQTMNGASQKLAMTKLAPFTPAPLTPPNPAGEKAGMLSSTPLPNVPRTVAPDISSQNTLETPTISLASLPPAGTRHRMHDKLASYMSRRSLKSGFLLLALLALLVAIGIGSSLWSLTGSHPSAHSSNTSVSSPQPSTTSNPSPTTHPAIRPTTGSSKPHPKTTPTKSTVPTIPTQFNQPVATPTSPPVVQSSPAPTPFPTATAIPNPTVLPTGHPTPRPTPSPTPRPTPTPVVYPNVSGNYNGTIDDTTENIVTGMALSISQKPGQSVITGYFSVNPALVGSNNFAGTVNTQKYIQFVVQSYRGNAPLYFWGWVQANGSMKGSYCSINSHNQCDANAGDAGTWNVSLVQSGSSYMLSISKDNSIDAISTSLMSLLVWITGMILMCILLLLITVRYYSNRRG